jgi:hypothetical protein
LRLAQYWLSASLAGRKLTILDEKDPFNTEEEVFAFYDIVQGWYYTRIMQTLFILYGILVPFTGKKKTCVGF